MKLEAFNGWKGTIEYEDIIRKASEEFAEELKKASHSLLGGTGEYAESWTYDMHKDKYDNPYGVVHNKEHYRLTHLLEHGHVSANQHGEYGRVAPKPHIKQQFDLVKDKFIDDMKDAELKLKDL